MTSTPTLLTCLLVIASLAPIAGADHAYHAVYQFQDWYSGCRVTLDGTYTGGSGSWMTWQFMVVTSPEGCHILVDGDTCSATGSIETGFSGWCTSGGWLSTSGTGHDHGCCPLTGLDMHDGIYLNYWSGISWWYYEGEGGVTAYG